MFVRFTSSEDCPIYIRIADITAFWSNPFKEVGGTFIRLAGSGKVICVREDFQEVFETINKTQI